MIMPPVRSKMASPPPTCGNFSRAIDLSRVSRLTSDAPHARSGLVSCACRRHRNYPPANPVMNPENFIVRMNLQHVQHFSKRRVRKRRAWDLLSESDRTHSCAT